MRHKFVATLRAPCSRDTHNDTKVSLLRFLFVNDYRGIQVDEDGTDPLILANCPHCGSTLAFEVDAEAVRALGAL